MCVISSNKGPPHANFISTEFELTKLSLHLKRFKTVLMEEFAGRPCEA